jgi:DHA1 family bicyclomycin/chloramphenicol resistance-like MFS transporter
MTLPPTDSIQAIQPPASRKKLIFILGLLSMLMPLSIDMYLPSFLAIANEFQVDKGMVQLTLSTYVIGFAVGQLFYGPMTDSLGRKPVIICGVIVFAIAAAGCALAQTIEQLIFMRLLHGLAAASASVVISALMRDMFRKEEFSRMMSFVTLVMTIAPLLAPIIGGWLLIWFSWQATFWVLSLTALFSVILVKTTIPETLPKEKRQKFHFTTTLQNFGSLFRHKQVICYMFASAFSFAGMFSFLSSGPFVYMGLNGVKEENFGYYFAINIVFMFVMTTINSRSVRRRGVERMMLFGLMVQSVMSIALLAVSLFHLDFIFMVLAVAGYMGCISMISSNAMAIILEGFPYMAGTAASLAGTLRFGVGALVGLILSKIPALSAWPMIISMLICVVLSFSLYLYASYGARKRK